MRRRTPRPAAFALEDLTRALAPATLLAEVQRAWPESVGPALARVAMPVAERDGIVTVACVAAVWAQELELMSEGVLARLEAVLGRPAVRGLRVQSRGLPG